MNLHNSECEIRIISESKGKLSFPKRTMFLEDELKEWQLDTYELDQKVIHKVPIGPLVTMNFTTNPNYSVKNKKKKDKKKTKLARSKKSKKTRMEGIPFPKGPNSTIPRNEMLDLAGDLIQRRLESMKDKYNVNEYMFSTEPILEWDPSSHEDPNRYLDFIREIDEEMVKYSPYEVVRANQAKFAACYEKKRQRLLASKNENSDNSNIEIGPNGEPVVKYKYKESAKLKQLMNIKVKSPDPARSTPKAIEAEGDSGILFVDCTKENDVKITTIFDDRDGNSEEDETPLTQFDEEVNKKLKLLYGYLDQIGSESLANGMAARPANVDLTYLATDAASPSDVVIGAKYTDGLQVRVTYKGRRQELRDLAVVKAKL